VERELLFVRKDNAVINMVTVESLMTTVKVDVVANQNFVNAIYATDFSSLKNLTHLKELKIEDSLSDVNFCQKLPSELRSLCKTSYTTKKSSTKTTKTTKTSTKKTTKKTTTKTTRTTKITKTKTTKTTKKNNSLPTNSTDKCGKGVAICKEGYCCSKYGYCGKSDDYCKSSRGCQSEFGH